MTVALINPYVSLTEAQDFLEDSTAGHADRISKAINRASRYVDSVSAHIFYRKDYTLEQVQTQGKGKGTWKLFGQVFGNQAGFIKSPFEPIIKGSLQVFDNSALLIEGTDYIVDYENGKIYARNSAFGSVVGFLPNEIFITASVGYDNGTNPYNATIPSDDIPGDISFAALRIAALYSGIWRKAISTDGSGAVQFWNPTVIPKDIMETLWFWRGKK